VPRPNSRTKRPRKPKISMVEVHHNHRRNPSIYLEVKRSKVKVTRPINAHTVNAQYLPNGKAYERQTWYTDEARRHVSPTCAATSNSKAQGQGQGHVVCLTGIGWLISGERKGTETPKLVGRLPIPCTTSCMAAGCGRHGMPLPACNNPTLQAIIAARQLIAHAPTAYQLTKFEVRRRQTFGFSINRPGNLDL